MAVRAVRGAVQLDQDEAGHMDERVSELLTAVLERNSLTADDLISVWFTATPTCTATSRPPRPASSASSTYR